MSSRLLELPVFLLVELEERGTLFSSLTGGTGLNAARQNQQQSTD